MTALVLLSLFRGIGLLDAAAEEVFPDACIVAGPDLLWGGDIRRWHAVPGVFDLVFGGPPCQAFSRLRHVNPKCGEKTGNLVPEFERVVLEAQPTSFLMENVSEAPIPHVDGYVVRDSLVRDCWVGGETTRLRRFSFGTRDGRPLAIAWVALHTGDPRQAVLAGGGGRRVPVARGGSGKVKRSRARDIPDVSRSRLAQALTDQGLPTDFLAGAPFTVKAQQHLIGEGVPLPMGRAVFRAVKRALEG